MIFIHIHSQQTIKRLKIIALIVTLGGLLFGIDTGVINGAIPYMATPQQLNLTPTEEGLVTSGITLGASIGALISGRLADRYGRRKMLFCLSFIFLAGTFACSTAPNAVLMIIFRFLLGLAVGGASVIVPTYLAEISTTAMWGRLVTQNELMITGGQLLAFTVNAGLGVFFPHVGSIWRYMIAFGMIPSIMLFIGLWYIPESPRWSLMAGDDQTAVKTLKQVRQNDKQIQNEITSIKEHFQKNKMTKQASLKDLRHPWVRNLILIGVGLGIMQQFAGINIMMYYGTTILMKVGFGHSAALVANIGNGVTSFIATIVGMRMMYTVDRRKMLLTGLSGTTAVMICITLSLALFQHSPALPYIIICALMCFLAFFQSCVSPTTWVLLSEIFPQNMRGLGMGISTFALWLANFAVGFIFPIMVSHWGSVASFGFFIICNVLSLAFAARFAPETQGKSLEEIQQSIRQRLTASKHHHHHWNGYSLESKTSSN